MHGSFLVFHFGCFYLGLDGLWGLNDWDYRFLDLAWLTSRLLAFDGAVQTVDFLGRKRRVGFFLVQDGRVRLGVVVEARGNQGHAEGFAEAFVGAVTPNDVRVVAAGVLGDFQDFIHLV